MEALRRKMLAVSTDGNCNTLVMLTEQLYTSRSARHCSVARSLLIYCTAHTPALPIFSSKVMIMLAAMHIISRHEALSIKKSICGFATIPGVTMSA